jgi:hypothetical protein
MTTRPQGRRVSAGLTLLAMALIWATPVAIAASHCAIASTSSELTVAPDPERATSPCDHYPFTRCTGPAGCQVVPPALATTPTLQVLAQPLLILTPCPPQPLADRYRAGPPTPPPNQI